MGGSDEEGEDLMENMDGYVIRCMVWVQGAATCTNSQPPTASPPSHTIHHTTPSDYRANPLLDRYEEDGLDNDYAGEDDAAAALAARRAAERELDRRDVREGKRGRRALPGALGTWEVVGYVMCMKQLIVHTHHAPKQPQIQRKTVMRIKMMRPAVVVDASVAKQMMHRLMNQMYVITTVHVKHSRVQYAAQHIQQHMISTAHSL